MTFVTFAHFTSLVAEVVMTLIVLFVKLKMDEFAKQLC